MAKVKKSDIRRLITIYETKGYMYINRAEEEGNTYDGLLDGAYARTFYEVAADLHKLIGEVEVQDEE